MKTVFSAVLNSSFDIVGVLGVAIVFVIAGTTFLSKNRPKANPPRPAMPPSYVQTTLTGADPQKRTRKRRHEQVAAREWVVEGSVEVEIGHKQVTLTTVRPPRPNQIQIAGAIYDGLKADKHVVVISPTGSGKTKGVSDGIRAFLDNTKDPGGIRLVIAVNNHSLLSDISRAFAEEGHSETMLRRAAAERLCTNEDVIEAAERSGLPFLSLCQDACANAKKRRSTGIKCHRDSFYKSANVAGRLAGMPGHSLTDAKAVAREAGGCAYKGELALHKLPKASRPRWVAAPLNDTTDPACRALGDTKRAVAFVDEAHLFIKVLLDGAGAELTLGNLRKAHTGMKNILRNTVRHNVTLAYTMSLFMDLMPLMLSGDPLGLLATVEPGDLITVERIAALQEAGAILAPKNASIHTVCSVADSLGRIAWALQVGLPTRDYFSVRVVRSTFRGKTTAKICMQCLNPKWAFAQVEGNFFKWVFASGTLGQSFRKEIGIWDGGKSLPVIMPHIVDAREVLRVFPVNKWHDGTAATNTYSGGYSLPSWDAKCARTIERLVKGVQGGVLLFLPSKALVDRLMKALDRKCGATFMREDSSTEGRAAGTEAYHDLVAGGRCVVLVSVLRGGYCQGVNMKTSMVIVVGVPYPPPNTDEALAVKAFRDKYAKELDLLSYRDLVEEETMGAVLQAMGRTVRGTGTERKVAILLDARYHAVLRPGGTWAPSKHLTPVTRTWLKDAVVPKFQRAPTHIVSSVARSFMGVWGGAGG